jgi:hypothetical protein
MWFATLEQVAAYNKRHPNEKIRAAANGASHVVSPRTVR